MKNDSFNHKNPFAVPEGYFDNLQNKVMERIRKEEGMVARTRVVRFKSYRTLVAAAACVLLLFTAGVLWWVNPVQQPAVAEEWYMDDNAFFQLMYTSDIPLVSEVLNTSTTIDDNDWTEEQEQEIIHFLERDNMMFIAIANSMDL